MKIQDIVAAAVGLAGCASALPSRKIWPRQTSNDVLPPKQDPWYSAPANFSSAAPGTILRIRSAPGNLTAITGSNCSAAYNILYRTTNSQYQPTWAVTTLFIPASNVSSQNNSLLSYQLPYDSADLNASPSYAAYQQVNETDVAVMLGRGWWVSVPDYEGPLASFTAGVISGHATLDSVRAVLNSSLGLVNNTRYAMWGYSGGALASEWAAELQVQYAPELNFSGAALGGLTPNVTNVLLSVTGTAEAGLVPAGILGLASQHPDLQSWLQSNLNPSGPYNATSFYKAYNQSLGEGIAYFFGQNISNYFQSGVAAYSDPIISKITNRDGVMGYHGIPQMPLFVYKAIKDETSPIVDTDNLVQRYCGVGATIRYDRNTIGSHPQEYVNGEARAFEFLTSVLGGAYNATGCQIQNVTIGTE